MRDAYCFLRDASNFLRGADYFLRGAGFLVRRVDLTFFEDFFRERRFFSRFSRACSVQLAEANFRIRIRMFSRFQLGRDIPIQRRV